MNEQKPNFLDRGTLTAFALILLFWFGWSKFIETKYPSTNIAENKPAQSSVPSQPASSVQEPQKQPLANSVPITSGSASEEKVLVYDSDNFSFRLSSKGMGISDINIKKFGTRTNDPIILGAVEKDRPFATHLAESGLPIDFVIERPTPDTFVGRASLNGYVIEKTIRVQSSKYVFETEINLSGNLEGFRGLTTTIGDTFQLTAEGGFLSGTPEHQDWFLRHENTKTRKVIDQKSGTQVAEKNVSIAALSAHYFTIAIVDHSEIAPSFESNFLPAAKSITGQMKYQPISKSDAFRVKYVGYAGPKSYELLAGIDENLPQIVDFGMFGVLGKPILWLLKYLHSIFNNWGWAIVVLTLIVRLIVLPFNAYSFRSMKAMQKIQPEMNRIKEKYKDKPADAKLQMNQEIMQLMKANNASPVGGCLPTLLQLPVFFALYQVLGQSIELYRAPFIFWIRDLSMQDQYFVLPVLMGITMFLQQKLTPTTMDPQQAKILQWMPVIFSAFMLTLPSGLTLYIFVSTLFSIIQQYYFMKDKSAARGRVKEAKA